MTIDFHTRLMALDGTTPLTDGNGQPVRLGPICANALCVVAKPGTPLEDKDVQVKLAKRIGDALEPMDLTAEDIARIKWCVNQVCSPLVTVGACAILDPKPEPVEAKTEGAADG